ncbi:MAG: HNH endonuclease [Hellea sp.]
MEMFFNDLALKSNMSRKSLKRKPSQKRSRQLKYYEILTRPNQSEFRRDVIKRFKGRCALTGCRVLEAMEAAHIVPIAEDGSDEAKNGILLRRDIHRLFDLDLILISPKNGNVKLDSRIHAEYRDQIEASIDLKLLDVETLKLRYN